MIHKNEEDQKCLFLQKEYFCLRYNREGKQRMYEEFLKQIEDFIFIEDKPEKADVIFVPGNGYPQMAEKAVQVWNGAEDTSKREIQYYSWKICRSAGKKRILYRGL